MTGTVGQILRGRDTRFSVGSDSTLRRVLEYMREKNTGVVAATRDKRVIGVFTTRDIRQRVVLEDLDLDTVLVETMMSTPVHWISDDERYEVAKAIMVDRRIRQLVVLDKNKAFIGFVSASLLLEADLKNSRELVTKLNDSYYAPRFEPQ
jgi:CBS domain-containing protein